MKSTIFYFGTNSPSCMENKIADNKYVYEVTIPILPAYAVEYFVVQIGALSCFQEKDEVIQKDKLILMSEYSFKDSCIKVVIYYHGIRDYSLLFPWVSNDDLKKRLGEFYREAELNFDIGAWLSFALMSGAIFEGILYAKLNSNDRFEKLIKDAASSGLIDNQTQTIMNKVRDQRNLVHANRHTTLYVTRADAMDIRTILDKLIKEA